MDASLPLKLRPPIKASHEGSTKSEHPFLPQVKPARLIMKITAFFVLGASISSALAAVAPVERALPEGHPIIDNSFLPDENYTLPANLWPSGFSAPTETLTALPSGYSVGPHGVYAPDGETVSAFPASVVTPVAVFATSTAPAVSDSTSVVSDTSSAAAAATTTPNDAVAVSSSRALWLLIAAGVTMLIL